MVALVGLGPRLVRSTGSSNISGTSGSITSHTSGTYGSNILVVLVGSVIILPKSNS